MKNVSLVLNGVLLVAVAVIYFLHFSGGSRKTKSDQEDLSLPVEVTSNGIAYVNIDSVILNFTMYTDKRAELTEKQQKSENDLNSRAQAYERGVKDYQDKASKGLVTRATAQQMEESLMQQQQALVDLRDRLGYELMEEEQVMNRQILDYITTYLDSMKSEYNFQYILGKTFGGPILYSDQALDITATVIQGINNKYNTEKAEAVK
ncbi:MAG: OmpH family outer membrane protein [Bacteroidetes bacterium]|nr:OmpH family outer membrane protein [Bacteroidota bacterium]